MIQTLLTSGATPVAFLLAVAVWELLTASAPPPGTLRRWITNFALFALDQGAALIVAPLMTLVARGVGGVLPLPARHPVPPGWLHAAVALLVLDAATYWLHRLSHRVGPLWRIHAVHHADLDLDVTTTIRHHPLEAVPNAVALGFCAALIGLLPSEVAAYAALSFLVQLIAHADLRLPSGPTRALGLVLVTPQMHRLHHSRREAETNSNYGQMLSVWDRLFGSFVPQSQAGGTAFGLDEYAEPRFHGIAGALAQPLVRPAARAATSVRG